MLLTNTTYQAMFATFLGGPGSGVNGDTTIRDIAVDKNHNFFVTGGTKNPNFPTTPGAYDTTHNGGMDVFIAKFTPTGQLVWSTFFGGHNTDRAYAIELDSQGNVVVSGRAGDNLPTTPGALQTTFAGDNNASPLYGKQDGFVAKFSPDGSQLLFSTYFGDASRGFIRDIALDAQDHIFLILTEASGPNPYVTPGAWQTTQGGGFDGVVAKLTADGSSVIWASYIGGSKDDLIGPSLRVDKQGFVYVAGSTNSADFPTTLNSFGPTFNGIWDISVTKFKPDGSGVVYSTYLGGSGDDQTETHELWVDDNGDAYAAGIVTSTDLPVTSGVYQPSNGGTNGTLDGYVAKISPDGSKILAATYLGGTSNDDIQGISLDAAGNVYVSGVTSSTNFPVTPNAYQSTYGGGVSDMHMSILSNDLSQLEYSTYWGGSGDDEGRTDIVSPDGWFAVAGHSNSTNLPTTANAYEPTRPGGANGAFIVFAPAAQIRVSQAGTSVTNGSTAPISFGFVSQNATPPQLTFTITNAGGSALNLGSLILSNNSEFAVVQSPPSTIPGGGMATFVLQMLTSSVGSAATDVSIATNDPNAPQFVFQVAGDVVALKQDVLFNGTPGDDSFYVKADPTGQFVEIWQNGNPTTGPATSVKVLAAVQSFIVNGFAGDDTLTLDFSNGNPLPPSGLNFDGGGAVSADTLRVVGSSAAASINVSESQVLFNSTAIALTGVGVIELGPFGLGSSLVVNGHANVLLTATVLASLSIADNARVTLSPGTKRVLITPSLTINDAGTLDLADNDLILQTTAATRDAQLAAVFRLVASGLNNNSSLWQGVGITSSAAAANLYTGLATMANDRGGNLGPLLTMFDGQSVDVNSILIKYTWNGDMDLNGRIDADDYFRIDTGFLAGLTGYQNGDLNYSGKVDADDYFLADSAFLRQTGVLSLGQTQAALRIQSTPPIHHKKPGRKHHHRAPISVK